MAQLNNLRSGVPLIESTMYQPVPTSEYFDGMASEESLDWKGATQWPALKIHWYQNVLDTFSMNKKLR